jgi:hypothetical protein
LSYECSCSCFEEFSGSHTSGGNACQQPTRHTSMSLSAATKTPGQKGRATIWNSQNKFILKLKTRKQIVASFTAYTY